MVPRLVLIVAWWALLVSIVNSGGFDHFFGIGLSLSCWMLTVDRRTKTRRAPCRVVQGQDIRPILLKPSRLGKSLVMVKRTRTTFHRPIPRPSITATTNDHQPETNDHQPPTTNHQPTTNNQTPTTKHQPPRTNNQQPTTNNQQRAKQQHIAATSPSAPPTIVLLTAGPGSRRRGQPRPPDADVPCRSAGAVQPVGPGGGSSAARRVRAAGCQTAPRSRRLRLEYHVLRPAPRVRLPSSGEPAARGAHAAGFAGTGRPRQPPAYCPRSPSGHPQTYPRLNKRHRRSTSRPRSAERSAQDQAAR